MTAIASEFTELAAALSGQYDLEREIGRGGMGVVYRARDVKLDRRVAIKTLPRHMADSATRDRFLREARTAASLSHPNIVPIYRADETGGFVYFAMAYVEGQSLAERVKTVGPLAPREAARYLRDVALALGYAHAHGVIHRDVKAENILLEQGSGRAMVTDFGIARVADAAPLTATGHVLGTVHYMSPEQVAGDALDGRTDLYALGVVGFLTLSGAFPFDHATASAVLVAHVTKRAPALMTVAPHVPRALAAVIDRCLRREPEERFASGEEVARALDAVLASPEIDAAEAAPRVLSEAEANAVWQRASELQALTGTQVPPPLSPIAPADASRTTGYPLANVRASALEAGISEQFVARALGELGLTPAVAAASGGGALVPVESLSSRAGVVAGAPMELRFEAKVPGEASGRDYDLLVEVIRRQLGDVGQVSTVGRSLAWTGTNVKRRVGVTVVPRGGSTTIRVEERMGPMAGQLFGGIVGGGGGGFGGGTMGITIAATHSIVITLAVTLGIVTSAYGLARTLFVRGVRTRGEELRELTVRLAEAVSESMGQGRR
jgi:serine/threonine-protein kinase